MKMSKHICPLFKAKFEWSRYTQAPHTCVAMGIIDFLWMNRVTDITVCQITYMIDSCPACMSHVTCMNNSGQLPYFAHVSTLLRRSRALLNIWRLFGVCTAQRVGLFCTCVSSLAHAWALLRISRAFFVCVHSAYRRIYRALWHVFKGSLTCV